MKRNTKKVVIEAEVPKSLTAVGVDAVDAAIAAAKPYVQQAREVGSERVKEAEKRLKPLRSDVQARLAPVADQARDRAHQAQDFLAPYYADAQARVAPVSAKARARTATGAQGILREVAPRVENALHSLAPVADNVAERIHDDYVPAISEFLDRAAGVEKPRTRRQRRKANKAARRADKLQAKASKLADKEQRKLAKQIAKDQKSGPGAVPIILVVLGVAAIAAFVAKKLAAGNQADAWQNYRPTQPAPAAAPTPARADTDDTEGPVPTEQPAEEAVPRRADLGSEDAIAPRVAETAEEAEAEMVAEGGPVTAQDTVSSDTPSGDANSYGADSYVGLEPPEAFRIKGNPRSMKYHVPGSDSYERTITDVWFSSEEAAEQAGFSRATR